MRPVVVVHGAIGEVNGSSELFLERCHYLRADHPIRLAIDRRDAGGYPCQGSLPYNKRALAMIPFVGFACTTGPGTDACHRFFFSANETSSKSLVSGFLKLSISFLPLV